MEFCLPAEERAELLPFKMQDIARLEDYISTSHLTGAAGVGSKEETGRVGQKEGVHFSGCICTEVEKASVPFVTSVSSFEIVWKFLPQSFSALCSQTRTKSDALLSHTYQPSLFTECLSSLSSVMTEKRLPLAIILIAVISEHG